MKKAFLNERLDHFLARQYQLSRKASVNLIKQDAITVNKKPINKASFLLKQTDNIVIKKSFLKPKPILDLDLPIIYEDNNVIVIDKPIGILSHSKGKFNPEATVETWLQQKVADLKYDRAGIVHRLDRATSGVMILAKNSQTQSMLQKQFSQRKTKKIYTAVISGQLNPKEAVIDMPINRNPKKPQTFRVDVNGKSALTHYLQLKNNNKYSLVELRPTTGRTHQLRVHLAYLKHPILGDNFYNGEPAERLYLHASSLEITLPDSQRKVFKSSLPKEFKYKVKQ